MAQPNQESSATPAGRRRPNLVVALVLVALSAGAVGAVAGYVVRGRQPAVAVRIGSPHSTPFQVSIQADGWVYDVPLNVQWRDATGGWHEGIRPTCLPPDGELPPVKFATVNVNGPGPSWRQVVWVDCGN